MNSCLRGKKMKLDMVTNVCLCILHHHKKWGDYKDNITDCTYWSKHNMLGNHFAFFIFVIITIDNITVTFRARALYCTRTIWQRAGAISKFER
ncbi:hypothetical protein ACJX0J_039334, partial [Zea mays]